MTFLRKLTGLVGWVVFVGALSAQSVPWIDAGYHYRASLSGLRPVGSTQTNFPVLIRLTNQSFLTNVASSAGDDITFGGVDGRQLFHEIEDFDRANGNLIAWVSLPSFTNNSLFYLYYGNTNTSYAFNGSNTFASLNTTLPSLRTRQISTNVWDTNFLLVMHLNETSGVYTDSTRYAFNSTAVAGNVTRGASSFVGRGMSTTNFPQGSGITVSNGSTEFLGPHQTISMFYKMTFLPALTGGAGANIKFVTTLGAGSVANSPFFFRFDTNTSGGNGGSGQIDYRGIGTSAVFATNILNKWTYLTFKGGPTNLSFPASATNGVSSLFTNGVIASASSLGAMIITNIPQGLFIGGPSPAQPGGYDEYRFSKMIRSDTWMRTEYTNQLRADTNLFYTLSAPELNLFASATITNPGSMTWITNTLWSFSGTASSPASALAGVYFSTNATGPFALAAGTADWSTNVDVTSLSNKTNVFWVIASNLGGGKGTNRVTNVIDFTPPFLAFARAYSNRVLNGVTNISGTNYESFAPVVSASLRLETNGVLITNWSLAPAASNWTTNINTSLVPDGRYDLRLVSTNAAGLASSLLQTNIFFSNQVYAVVPLTPTNNAFVSSVTVLTGYVTAPFSQTFYSNSATGGWVTTAMNGTNWSSSLNLSGFADGEVVTIAFGATNQFGNMYGLTNRSVVADQSPAVAEITNLSGGEYLSGIYTFHGTNADTTSGVSSLVRIISNATGFVSRSAATLYGSGNWSNAVDTTLLSDGAYWISLAVTNGAGIGSNTDSLYFYVNNRPPVVTLTNTAPFIWISGTRNFVGLATNASRVLDPPEVTFFTNGVAAESQSGTNWVFAVDTTSLPDGTNIFAFQAVSSNFKTNVYYATNRVDNSPAQCFLTNPSPGATISATVLFSGTNAENVSYLTGWSYTTNGGTTWTSIVSNTNSAWRLLLDVSGLPNGPAELGLRVTNASGLETVTNHTFYVSNLFPVLGISLPTAGAWMTNVNTAFSGTASSPLSPLTGVYFSSNTNGPFGLALGTSSWSTNNGNWAGLNRRTNAFAVIASNAAGFRTMAVQTNFLELSAPPLAFAANYANTSMSNATNLAGSVDSFSPLGLFSLSIFTKPAGTLTGNYNLLPSLSGTNFTYSLNTIPIPNGRYDFRLTASNEAGWVRVVTNTNITVTNLASLFPVATWLSLESSASQAMAGSSFPFHLHVLDQYTNILNTNGTVGFVFSGPSSGLYADSASVQGVPLGTTTPIVLSSGTASNLSLVPVKAESATLTVSAPGTTALSNLALLIGHGPYSSLGSYLEADVKDAVMGTSVENRLYVRDVHGNPVLSNFPPLSFLRYSWEGGKSDHLLQKGPSNLLVTNAVVPVGGQSVAISAFLGAMNENDRVRRDGDGTNDGWIQFTPYRISPEKILTLLEMKENRGGVVLTQNPVSVGTPVEIYGSFAVGTKLELALYAFTGAMVYQWPKVTVVRDGIQSFSWDGSAQRGLSIVPKRPYILVIRVTDPGGGQSEKYFKMGIR